MNPSLAARPTPEIAAAAAAPRLAVLSLGAAAIHFAVIPDHLAEWWAFGLFFAALGWFQALWAVAYLIRPTAGLAGFATVVNLVTVVLWAWSRSVGLPVGPEPGVAESIGAPDVIATVLEIALVAGLVAMTRRPGGQGATTGPGVARPAGDRWLTLLLAVVVATATTIAIAAGAG